MDKNGFRECANLSSGARPDSEFETLRPRKGGKENRTKPITAFVVLILFACGLEASEGRQAGMQNLSLARLSGRVRAADCTDCQPAVPFDSTPILLDTTLKRMRPRADQSARDVAYDGTNFLVVWADARPPDGPNVLAARVSPAGVALDSPGIDICSDVGSQSNPAVAFDGTNYMVVWADARLGKISGCRVNRAGEVIDPEPFVIPSNEAAEMPKIAYGDGNYLVAWRYHYTTPENGWDYTAIIASRVSKAGEVLDGHVLEPATTQLPTDPDVAFCGNSYLVVWLRWSCDSIRGSRVSTTGQVLDSTPRDLARGNSPAIACGGSVYLLTWADTAVHGVRLDSAGNPLDSTVIQISSTGSGQMRVANDGADFFAVWSDGRIHGARISPAGELVDTISRRISLGPGLQRFPALVCGSGGSLVVWSDQPDSAPPWLARGSRVTTQGIPVDSTEIVMTGSGSVPQSSPAAALCGTNYFVVWENAGDSGIGITGTRLSSSGTVLNPSGILISAGRGDRSAPSVASCGGQLLTAWTDLRSGSGSPAIYGTRVDYSGYVLDPNGIHISLNSTNASQVSVTSNGTDYFVVWRDSGSSGFQITGARVSTSGQVLDGGIRISGTSGSAVTPKVTFNGTDYLAVWQVGGWPYYDIYGARIGVDGAVIDTQPFGICTCGWWQSKPCVAPYGPSCFVVYEDGRRSWVAGHNYYYAHDIYATKVAPWGAPILDTVVAANANGKFLPTTTFDGSRWVAAWEDRTGVGGEIWLSILDTLGGTIFGPERVVYQRGAQVTPVLCHGLSGQVLLVYSGWAGTAGGKRYDAMRAWGKLMTFSGIEEPHAVQTPSSLSLRVEQNPFRSRAAIRLALDRRTHVSLRVCDLSGRVVREVLNRMVGPGRLSVTWSGSDQQGRAAPAGLYFCCLEADGQRLIRKLVLTK